jgi:hypothetical protein
MKYHVMSTKRDMLHIYASCEEMIIRTYCKTRGSVLVE